MLFTLTVILIGLLLSLGIQLVLLTVIYNEIKETQQAWFIGLIIITITVFIFSTGFYTYFLTDIRSVLELGR